MAGARLGGCVVASPARLAVRMLLVRLLAGRGGDAASARAACAALRRPPPIVRFHGRRWREIERRPPRQRRRNRRITSCTRLPLNEILQLERDRVGARRAAAGPGARRPVDRPSLRPALHRPRGQGVFPRGRSREQRAAARSGRASPATSSIDAACLDWIPDTLGQLAARHGVYFVLGNHDRRVDRRPASPHAGGRADWSISAADGCRSRLRGHAGRCWPATNGRGSWPRRRDMQRLPAARSPATADACGSCWRTPPINSPGRGPTTPT